MSGVVIVRRVVDAGFETEKSNRFKVDEDSRKIHCVYFKIGFVSGKLI